MTNNAIRWRLTWWLAAEPTRTRYQWYTHACRFCAGKRAYALGCVMADLARVDRKNVRWSISRPNPLGGELTIELTDRLFPEIAMRRHAHR